MELKYTKQGPRLIEVNCRMGGGPVRNTNLLVWGVDLVEEHLLTCAGIPSRPPVAARPLMYIGEYSINAKKTGKLQHTDFLKVGSFDVLAMSWPWPPLTTPPMPPPALHFASHSCGRLGISVLHQCYFHRAVCFITGPSGTPPCSQNVVPSFYGNGRTQGVWPCALVCPMVCRLYQDEELAGHSVT